LNRYIVEKGEYSSIGEEYDLFPKTKKQLQDARLRLGLAMNLRGEVRYGEGRTGDLRR